MALKEAGRIEFRDSADLGGLVDALASPEAPLTRSALDSLLGRVLASGNPELCVRLVLTVHGRESVTEARTLVMRCLERFPEEVELVNVRDLIAPPRVTPSPDSARIDRRPDFAWLTSHAAEYPGEWLVLSRGRLWAHAPSLPEAQAQAQAAGLRERPLLHHVPAA